MLRQKRTISTFIFLFLIMVMMGCGKTNSTTNTDKKMLANYFPMQAGSYWEYEGEGNEYASYKRVVIFTKDNLYQTSFDNGGTVATEIFSVTPEAVNRSYFAGENYNPSNLLEKGFEKTENKYLITPLAVGTKWQDGDTSKEITALDASVDTPAGKFENCIKVQYSSQADAKTFRYYKEGVGLVMEEYIAQDYKIFSRLKKYGTK